MDPFLNEACAQFLKPYCDGYQLNLLQASMIDPGEGLQTLHRDRLLWGGYVPREMEPQFSMIFALTDFRTDNGATQVVPGSHRWEDDRQPEDHEITQAVMSAGSVLIYTGSVLHGGGENRSDTPRTGLIMHFSLNWLRQEENMYLSCPPEIARDFNPGLREVLGYSMACYTLGFYSDPVAPGEGWECAPPKMLFKAPPKPLAK